MQTSYATITAPARKNAPEKQSLLSYCIQGASFMGFMLFLFWMAGLKF